MEHHNEDSQHEEGPKSGRRFSIWIQGRLDSGFSDGLDGITQHVVPTGTLLTGSALDQSRLHSILDHLRRLGIDVLRFEAEGVDTRPLNDPDE